MTTQTLPLAPGPEETTAGNYFVANYPPFSFWSPDRVGEAQAALEAPPPPGTPLGLYVHIPFCRRRCHFCYFKVYTDKNAREIHRYLTAILRELEMLVSRPFLGGRKPEFIYFGGGTPSYLSPEQLRFLFDGLRRLLPWDQAREIAFEGEPGTLNERKLVALRELGVTRLSLGVENFDDAILQINGRAHGSKEIDRAYATARAVGFPQINIDLIAGMVNETPANWRACIDKTLALAPDSVTIYQMEVPFNTTIYRQMKEEGKLTAPVADWGTKRQWVQEAFAALEAAGYTVGSAYTAVKDPQRTRFLYRDSLWTGADMLAVGVASFGYIGGTHYQNQHDFAPYLEAVEAGTLPVYRALATTPEERLVRQFILQLKLGHLDADFFAARFGVDVLQRFAEPLRRLADAGWLRVEGREIRLRRDALLQVDRLLPEFYLPAHRGGRYA